MDWSYIQRLYPIETLRVDTINGVRLPPVASDTPSSVGRVFYKAKGKANTTNFGWYLANGVWKPDNPYFVSIERLKPPQGSPYLTLVWIPTGDKSEYYGGDADCLWGSVPYLEPTQAERSSMRDWALLRCREKIQDQKVNLSVFFAERAQSLGMIGDAVSRIAKAYRNVKRKNFKKAFEDLRCKPSKRLNAKKTSAQNWLELQYGWLPLVSDIYGAAQEIERSWKERTKKPTYYSVSASRSWSNGDTYQTGLVGMKVKRQGTYKCRVKITYTVDYQASQFLGRIGLTNPLSILWEKTPFSFVVDWALPIGRFLNSLDATLGCNFVGGSNSGTTQCTTEYDRDGTTDVGNFRYIWKYFGMSGQFFKYERGAEGGLPAITLPQFKDPSSTAHCANALALLVQVFKL